MWSVRKRCDAPPAPAGRGPSPGSRRAGFTLIEVLVAVTVAIILGGALVRFFGDVRARSTRAEDTLAAWTVARAVLEQATAKPALSATSAVGASGSYSWRLEVFPMAQIAAAPPAAAADGADAPETGGQRDGLFSSAPTVTWTAFRVRVVVEGRRGGAARLETVRLAGGGTPASDEAPADQEGQ